LCIYSGMDLDFNNIKNNVIMHAGGRCGTHRLLDLIILNNENFSIVAPSLPDKSVFEMYVNLHSHHYDNMGKLLDEYSNPNKRILKEINHQGKQWIIKNPGRQNFAYDISQEFTLEDFIHIGLYRKNLTDWLVSFIISLLTVRVSNQPNMGFHYLNQKMLDEQTALEKKLIMVWKLPATKDKVVEYSMLSLAIPLYTLLTNSYHYNITMISYEQILNNPEELFNKTDNIATSAGTTIFSPTQRLISPKLEELRSLIIPEIKDLLPRHADAASALAPPGIEFTV